MGKYLVIYEEAVSHVWLCNRSLLHFLIYDENFVFFLFIVAGQYTLHNKHISLMLRLRYYQPFAIFTRGLLYKGNCILICWDRALGLDPAWNSLAVCSMPTLNNKRGVQIRAQWFYRLHVLIKFFKFFSYIRIFRRERLQSHIWGRAS
jgi:hypothetical protein